MKFIKYLPYLSPILISVVALSICQADEGSSGSCTNSIKFYFALSIDAGACYLCAPPDPKTGGRGGYISNRR